MTSFWVDYKLLTKQKAFWLSVSLYVVILIGRSMEELAVNTEAPISYFLHFMYTIGGVSQLLMLVACLFTATYFTREVSSRYALFRYARLRRHRYSVQTLGIAMIGTASVVLFAHLLYMGVLCAMGHPWFQGTIQQSQTGFLSELLTETRYPLYYLLIVCFRMFEVMFYCGLTVVISLWVRDSLVIAVFPLVLQALLAIHYGFIQPNNAWFFPSEVLNSQSLLRLTFNAMNVPSYWMVVYSGCYVAIASVIFYIIFRQRVSFVMATVESGREKE